MTRLLSRVNVVVLLALFLAAACDAAPAPHAGPTPPALYVKRNTWAETMIASRAAYLADQAQAPAASKTREPFVSDPIAGGANPGHVVLDVRGEPFLRLTAEVVHGGGNCHIWGDAKLIAKDGTVTWLGTLKPVQATVGWGQLLVDRNWQNHPLVIGCRTFAHGLWVHAPSDLVFVLRGKYERFEAYYGLDADRATGTARFSVLFTNVAWPTALWQQMNRDFPTPCRWFAQDTHYRGVEWFANAKSLWFEQSVFAHATSQLSDTARPLQEQWAALQKAHAGTDDPRWLETYARACRLRECGPSLPSIWIAELRAILEQRIAGLIAEQVAADDPRWAELPALAQRLADPSGSASPVALASLRAAVAVLAADPGLHFQGAATLGKQLAQREAVWKELLAGTAKTPAAPVAGLYDEVRQIRRALLLGVPGMAEFLSAAKHVDLTREWDSQFDTLAYDLANRAQFERFASETYRPESLLAATDRDPVDVVLRRTAALTNALAHGQPAAYQSRLAELQSSARAIPLENREARHVLFAAACQVRRQIAWSNPLLDFHELLFVKRHRATYNHMCDQYYAVFARPGGGVCVLSDPFGPNAQVRDLTAGVRVTQGRLQGQKLDTGSFVAPALSYDARELAFAYVESAGDKTHIHHTDPTRGHWTPGQSYHLFKMRVDGTHLVQLTEGGWNDFDPCFLPNGRIAFITERRGGYLRCGRCCPNYTLFDMAADGSDINCLSFHETNEWQPSVTHDGRIVYTRWDYVDRHGCTAHLPWITTLDGRDSRALHGNFAPRQTRPDMELDVRAIPASHKYVATAAPHHGQAFGSLVLLDPRVPDDDAMAPVRRITPDVGFPESQGGREAYATAWPLGEDYFLCAYDADMATGRSTTADRGNYGLYLVDAFGNKELIYRDPAIACQSPMPLRPRPVPPLPAQPVAAARANPSAAPAAEQPPAEGELSVVNVYESLKPWPQGTKITALRVLHVLPMSVPSGGPPHDTAMRVAGAGDSVVAVRHVLGTVPVEADGSAHFVAPANQELFFQALNAEGLAVQSMRSATYLHAGEHLTCIGCHEPKSRSPQAPRVEPLAFRRTPSRLTPDVDGTNPFSYPRLVQPVLDRHCVECHQREAPKTFSLAREPLRNHWYASYANLVPQYGFHDYGGPMRTIPGQFGAQASKLYAVLRKDHYGVKLTPDELHRITLWLDCTSMFYGVYEKEGGEAQLRGEVVRATLE